MQETVIRPGRPAEAGRLSALALRSKAHWGYDPAFLDACRAALTVAPGQCDGVHVRVAEREGSVLGYARLAGDPPAGELADLFVDPPWIGQGIGGLLLADALETARRLGFDSLGLDADPHAEAFYLRAGARRVGSSPGGVVAGRTLPRLVFTVPA